MYYSGMVKNMLESKVLLFWNINKIIQRSNLKYTLFYSTSLPHKSGCEVIDKLQDLYRFKKNI